MIRGFTFERALSWPFIAPHIATFPWLFGAAYALAGLAAFSVIGLLAADDLTAWFNTMESLVSTTDEDAAFAAMTNGMVRLLPWSLLSVVAGWVFWAMFETASQRRYIWGATFSLGFGADELRMMVVGLLWVLLAFVVMGVPMLLVMGATFYTLFTDPMSLEGPEATQRVGMQVLGTFFLMVIIGPVYVFFATRLAPCFGLTVKEKRIRFFDAWNVSRGRFWPILGAYIILAVGGGIAGQVIGGIAQLMTWPATMGMANAVERGEDIRTLIFSPGFVVPMTLFGFIVMFIQGVMQHAVGGPAAFAVRHDPRGGVEETAQIGAFE